MLVVSDTGERAGQVLGRAISDHLAGRLAGLLTPGEPASRVVRLPVSADAAAAAGLACGGTMTVALHAANALPETFWSTIAAGRPAALVSVVDGDEAVRGSLVVAPDEVAGGLPDPALEEQAILAANRLLGRGRTAGAVISAAEGTLVVEAIVPAVRLVVVGSGDLAAALGRQADLLGWQVTIVEKAEPAAGALVSLGPGDGVVVLSHDPAIDTPVLEAALASPTGYIGALGSRRTQAARRDRLVGSGVSEAAVAAIHGPAGLDLGAKTPEEIALAICAELLAVRSGRAGMPLRQRTGSING
jgi:xanthine dehydrogenase accessory factor